ncbi:MAG: electron transfer flavoprotein subunit alpha/FixB family protein [Terriglobia bacterium]
MDVLVFIEHQAGKPVRASWEVLAAGQSLAKDAGATISAVILGKGMASLAAEVATAELHEVLTVESRALQEYTAEGYVWGLQKVIEQRGSAYILFGHTYQARDFAPRLAAALNSGLASDCLSYRWVDGRCVLTRQMFQGKLIADVELPGGPPYLISFQAGSFRADALKRGAAPARVTCAEIEVPASAIRTKPEEPFREARQAVDLGQAEIIVAAGRGIKAPENLELVKRLADALGGEVGASRPICDNGWLPMDRQIGSSGQTVAPKLYVALGVSGAIQHQVGMKASRTIVAINKDREAPIFEVASYGIIGDLFEVVPPLIEEIKRVKTG